MNNDDRLKKWAESYDWDHAWRLAADNLAQERQRMAILATVALSHEADCECVICIEARGSA